MRKVLQAGQIVQLAGLLALACVAGYAQPQGEPPRAVAVLSRRPPLVRGNADLVLATGHRYGVSGGEFTADGARIVTTGRQDDAIRVWQTATGIEERALPGTQFALSGDGKAIAVAEARRVAVWELATGRLLYTIGVEGEVAALALSGDGGRAAVLQSNTNALKVYEGEKELATLDSGWLAAPLLRFGADGLTLTALDANGDMEIRWTLRAWNIGTRKLLVERVGRTPSFEHGTDLSLFGTRMAVVERDGIAIWDAVAGRQVGSLPARATSVRFSQDGGVLASFPSAPGGDPAGPADLWEVAMGRLLRQVDEPVLAIAPNGSAVLTPGEEIWSSAGRIPLIEQHGSGALAWLPGNELASGTGLGRVLIWDPVAGRIREAPAGSGGAVAQIAASSGGRAILTASADGEVAILENGRARLLGAPGRWITAAAMSADGTRAGIAKASGEIRLWNPTTGAELRAVQGDPTGVLSLTLSPDGKVLAAGGIGGLVQAWDITTGRELLSLRRTGRVGAMAFSPDGRLLAFGSTVNTRLTRQADGQWGFPEEPMPGSHGELTLVDIATRREAGTLAHEDWTSALGFTGPQTLRAVSGAYGRPGAVRDYAAAGGHELRVVRDGIESDGTAVLSPDGETLASGVAGLGIRVWKLQK